MRSTQRVLHGTTDISEIVNDFLGSGYVFAYTTAGGALYIGAEVPFNQIWIEPTVVNAVAANLTVKAWWSGAWQSVVDLHDGTKAQGGTASLAQAGRVQWSLDRLKGWDIVDTSDDVTGLEGTEIYQMFWLKLTWSANLTATTKLKFIGQKFSRDVDLYGIYPDLNNAGMLASFASGKTTWIDQAYTAADAIVRDLISRKIVRARGQIFDHARFLDASIHKTAEIIYRGMGPAFEPQRKSASEDYSKAMNKDFFRVDANADGRLDPQEKNVSTSFLSR